MGALTWSRCFQPLRPCCRFLQSGCQWRHCKHQSAPTNWLIIYEFHLLCVVRYILYMKQLDLAMAQCISPRSSAHMILKMVVHGHMLWKMGVSQPTFFKWSLTSRELLLSQATNHWFLASQWQQGRENVNCSIQTYQSQSGFDRLHTFDYHFRIISWKWFYGHVSPHRVMLDIQHIL